MAGRNDGAPSGAPRLIFLGVSIVLIATFLWRLLSPAHEYPSRSVQMMTMVFDAAMLLGVFGLKGQARALAPEGDSRKYLDWLALAAVAAGLGLFAIRFLGGDSAWWTGHWSYALRPR